MAGNGAGRGAEKLAIALARGATVRDAAREAGLSARTANRRMGDPAFRALVSEARGEMVSRLLGEITALTEDAVSALRELLRSENAPVRLGAARTALAEMRALHETHALGERVSDLEARLEELRSGRVAKEA